MLANARLIGLLDISGEVAERRTNLQHTSQRLQNGLVQLSQLEEEEETVDRSDAHNADEAMDGIEDTQI